MNRRIITLIWFLLIIISLAACAHIKPEAKSEAALIRQVQQLWDAKIKKDWVAVYDLTIAAYQNKVPKERFLSHTKVNVMSYSIKETKILDPGDKALVEVLYHLQQQGYDFKMTSKEEWLFENGMWRLNLLPSTRSPIISK